MLQPIRTKNGLVTHMMLFAVCFTVIAVVCLQKIGKRASRNGGSKNVCVARRGWHSLVRGCEIR